MEPPEAPVMVAPDNENEISLKSLSELPNTSIVPFTASILPKDRPTSGG